VAHFLVIIERTDPSLPGIVETGAHHGGGLNITDLFVGDFRENWHRLAPLNYGTLRKHL
jgi:hypothetical protein